MDFRKLFQVLVAGGAMAGTQNHSNSDAGSEEPGGGGVQGW